MQTVLTQAAQITGGQYFKATDVAGLEAIYADFRPGDIRHSNADIGRARERLGYAPEVDFEAGLATTVDWFLRSSGE